MHFFSRCCLALGVLTLFPAPLPLAVSSAATVQQALYPEDEIALRREIVNKRSKEMERQARGQSSDGGSRVVPISQALPLSGNLQIVSGSTSTFYGKLRRDIKYTIKERFVGNLIITRFYDRKARKFTAREEYALDTISLEIDAADFTGKVCNKYSGSPPTCSQWQALDLWQVTEGEEYPGAKSSVVTTTSNGQTINLRIDGPDILFVPSQGTQKLTSGCGDLVQKRLTRDEWKQMIRQKTIRVKKVLGKTTPGCRPDSTIILEMKIGR